MIPGEIMEKLNRKKTASKSCFGKTADIECRSHSHQIPTKFSDTPPVRPSQSRKRRARRRVRGGGSAALRHHRSQNLFLERKTKIIANSWSNVSDKYLEPTPIGEKWILPWKLNNANHIPKSSGFCSER